MVRTPREPAGFHVRYRCPGVTIPGNTKLAEDPDAPRNQRTLIETRGEGGYALAPGSPPECHENNRPYLHQSGPEPSRLQDISPAERNLLWRCAAAFDLRPVEEEKVKGGTSKGKATGRTFTMGVSPGDDFNARGWEWEKIRTGWKEAAQKGKERRWRRPDKDKGWSATTGVCFGKANKWELLKVFSSNAGPFEPGGTYSKFSAYALLHHGGDFKAAAQALYALGFGTRRDEKNGTGKASDPDPAAGLATTPLTEIQPEPVRWLVEGLIPLGNPTDPKGLEKLLQRARHGDEKALPAVRELLKDAGAVDRLGGNLARQAEQSLIRTAIGANLAFREALTRKLDLRRAELGGPSPTPLERLLVERVVACWLQLHLAEGFLAQQEGKMNLTQAEYHERSRDRAHKRYLSSIKALALVRKLAVPVLQVNIARKQVNVAGTAVLPQTPQDAQGGTG